MKSEVIGVGRSQSPVVVLDDFTGNPERVAALADALAPFPVVGDSFYPGVRREIEAADGEADACMRKLCADAAPFVAEAFGIRELALGSASFSIVTSAADSLQPRQRYPHFDSAEPDNLALLLYLRVPAESGTAFYRQRATGIELVTRHNVATFTSVAQAEEEAAASTGYIAGSTARYEQIGAVDAVPDRMIIYPTNLLHSGIILDGMRFSVDPRQGRLTANLFVGPAAA